MNYLPPSRDEVRDMLLNAPHFIWPEFAAMPFNCFDLTTALLTFPGDISKSRSGPFADCADFKFDINDLSTCPRIDSFFETERWNENSETIRWFLGRLLWTCSPGSIRQFSVTQGFFSVHVNVKRFQNLEGIDDLTQSNQLKSAMYRCLRDQMKKGFFKHIPEDSLIEKKSNGNSWVIARSFNSCNFPVYDIACPIDHRTALYIGVDLDNCWFDGETIPEEVEQKHLASLWDFLSHVQLYPAGSGELEAGTIFRETQGQAEKSDGEKFEW